MVRLNEPPVLGDPLEALKRRFIRQNREIARANSIQSTKIRTLECETSRLLSENITLREENIKLQKELEQGQKQSGVENISLFKEKFHSKVSELNELLGELTKSTNEKETAPTPGRSRRKSHRQSLYQRHRPTAAELVEIAIAEGRLPPIPEDKLSPRKTPFIDEVHISIPDISNISDSPDLGPPPVSHFEDGDPIKQPSKLKHIPADSPSKSSYTHVSEESGADILSTNLETRRRRRESSNAKDGSNSSVQEVERSTVRPRSAEPSIARPKSVEPSLGQPFKLGAKRKLSTRDEESKLTKSMSQQDLASSRRRDAEEAASRPVARTKSHASLAAAGSKKEKPQTSTSKNLHSRKALGEKSVNTDPVVSPAKNKPLPKDKGFDAKKEEPQKGLRDPEIKEKSTIRQIRPIKPASELLRINLDPLDQSPATPIPLDDDVFSPDTNPSTARVDTRDTPPPTNLHSSADDNARPSRRQRSAVSYAEPNLRDKMRRPGKELVDAVTGLQQSRLSHGDFPVKDDRRRTINLDGNLNIPRLGDEINQQQPRTKSTEPTSPLSSRSSVSGATINPKNVSAGVVPDRRRRSTAVPQHNQLLDESGRLVSASQETISALITGSQKRLARIGRNLEPPSSGSSDRDMSSLTDSLSVFDLHLSSPPKGDNADTEEPTKADNRSRSTRTVKRHSSVSEGLVRRSIADLKASEESKLDESSLTRAERAERRRSMMV